MFNVFEGLKDPNHPRNVLTVTSLQRSEVFSHTRVAGESRSVSHSRVLYPQQQYDLTGGWISSRKTPHVRSRGEKYPLLKVSSFVERERTRN